MLAESAYRAGLTATQEPSRVAQRDLGQFMTPYAIAAFMAHHALNGVDAECLRILEPAAGSGVLIAATLQELLARDRPPRRIEILAYEIDGDLIPLLRDTCRAVCDLALARGVEVGVVIRHEDFLLSPMATAGVDQVDLVIANPPYFKIAADDPRALAHRYAVYGQPNIYGLFMAACARLVRSGGSWCFITPRSWMNGRYFSAVRQVLLGHLAPVRVHSFESRTASFRDDQVLQETVILWARAVEATQLVLSESPGPSSLDEASERTVSRSCIVDADDLAFHLRGDDWTRPPGWHETLAGLGLVVSTGPTVAFRSKAHIGASPSAHSVPLLWMQHVRRAGVTWPCGHPSEHLAANSCTSWMLLRNAPMVILRRFSPKEDIKRVTATAYLGRLGGDWLGLENHLNYIHRPGCSMTAQEVLGLAAVLNSERVDGFFRSLAGSTQINASDLRRLPLPTWDAICALGERLERGDGDVAQPDALIEQLMPRAFVGEPSDG
jgi:adenine-specific DNA-methyltransferase